MKHQQDEQDRVWIINHDLIPLARGLQELIEDFWGRRTILFEDGFKVMQWIEEVRGGRYDGPIPELILTTWRMPGPQGPEVCRELRQIPELDEMAIVIASAWGYTPEEMQWVMQTSQADLFIPKPLPMPDDLRASLEDVIEKRRQKVSGQ